jgi:hypothetical protein
MGSFTVRRAVERPRSRRDSCFWLSIPKGVTIAFAFLVVIPKGSDNCFCFLGCHSRRESASVLMPLSKESTIAFAFVFVFVFVFAVILSAAKDPEELHPNKPLGPFQLNPSSS